MGERATARERPPRGGGAARPSPGGGCWGCAGAGRGGGGGVGRAARGAAGPAFAALGPPARAGVFGTLEHCHERVIALAHAGVTDLNPREILALAPLLFLVFWIGLHPGPVYDVLHASVQHLVAQLAAVAPMP